MAEFDEKLNSILSNPDAMSQIMQLAQSLSGGQEQPSAPPSPPPPPTPAPRQSAPAQDMLSSLAGGLDPKLLTRLLPIIQELGSQQDSNARALL